MTDVTLTYVNSDGNEQSVTTSVTDQGLSQLINLAIQLNQPPPE